ncbi:hypothetical protein [Demequina muriae]|uniref:Glycosyltransferase RgtA/B/C/D-like domain-containing protein n=1 Tax=Demequina muriae TaxID=3051664 RepID=A0ABT8GHZ4_9MICO|nr:hypothetical protein [Demequina sp. EGI L300058]MDN4480999.1 hypothetical protein [Demequina sp. EGI L300058]
MTATAHDAAPAPVLSPALRAFASAPERLVLIGVALALAAGGAVSLGIHYWWTVLPAAAAITVLAWRPLGPRAAATAADARAGAIAVGGTVVWTVVNIALAAEYVIVVRDPGFLTLSGLWLADHPHTDIPAAGAVEAAAAHASALPDASEAWNLAGDVIQPQGAKMLPATIAIGGWVAGDTGVLAANVVIGALGILAVYAVARRFLGPAAALAPAGALALTVSHIGLSRAAYSEPLTLLLVIAGILWAWRGVEQRSLALIAAGAIASGATTFIRIDGAASAIGALAGVAVALALVDADRAWRRKAAVVFLAAQATVLTLGYVALARWSTEYLERLADEAYALLFAYGAVAGLVGVWVLLWSPRLHVDLWLPAWADALGRRGAIAAGAIVVTGMAVLASRPLWTTVHRGTEAERDRFTNGVVEGFQAAQGLPIEPTRTYAESTVTWLSYYLTWPLVVLGIIGLGIATYRMVRRHGGWAVFMGAVMAPTLVYLWRPAIVPDHLWAIRRFEPATLPGFVLAAAAAAWALTGLARTPAARAALRRVAAALMIVMPLSTWLSIAPAEEYPLSGAVNVTSREMIGARTQLDRLCAIDPGRPIVLVGTSSHFGSLRVMCDVPVVLMLSSPSAEDLAEMATAWERAPLVLTREVDDVPWSSDPLVVVESRVTHSGYSLQRIPRTFVERSYSWYAGVVDDTGEVRPVHVGETLTTP